MTQQDIDNTEAPLLDHLIELRSRLIKASVGFILAFLISFYFSSDIFRYLIKPFEWGTGRDDIGLVTIKLLGFFLVKLKIALFGGMFVAFPLIAMQMYRFVAPGLYKHERQALGPYLMATPIFFVLGGCLVYFFLLPVAIHFFYGLASGLGTTGDSKTDLLTLMPDVESYLDFVMMLILAFGLAFQLPVVLTLLGHIGVVSSAQLKSGRRFAIVGVCGIAALITPPDPMSMIAMAVPLVLLYELAVIAVGMLEKRRKATERAESDSKSLKPL
jgi:sec-independent protein translocase protein TatC